MKLSTGDLLFWEIFQMLVLNGFMNFNDVVGVFQR